MGSIGDVFFTAAIDDSRIAVDAKKTGDKIGKSLGDQLRASIAKSFSGEALGKGLVQGLGLAGGLGIANAVGEVKDAFIGTIESAAAFERGLLNVQSITKGTDEELAAMGDTVLDLGAEFGQSAETMTNALYDISSSGFAGAEALDVLKASTKAATAGLSTTAEAAAGITAVLNAYGLEATEAGRVSDVLFQTVNRGVVTFPELSSAIGTTTALAAPLGVSLEEVGAGLAVMTRAGIDAENATTQLNAIMASMLKPSAEASKLAKDLGLDWSAAGLKANGLVGQLQRMLKATNGNQEAMATLLGDARAIRGAFSLAARGGAEFAEELEIMNKAAGETDKAFGIQSKGAAFQLAQMQAKLEAAGIEIGQKFLPILVKLADFVSDDLIPIIEGLAAALDLLGGKLPETEEDFRSLNEFLTTINPTSWPFNLMRGQLEQMGEAAKDAHGKVRGEIHQLPSGIRDGAARTRRAAAEVGDAIEEPITAAAAEAERGVRLSFSSILAAIQETRDALTEPAQGLADEIFGPIEAAIALQETEAELTEQRRIIRDRDSTKEQVQEAKVRTVELRKELLVQQIDVAKFGDATTKIAAIKALLTSKEVTDAYREASPQQKQALDAWTTQLRLTMDTLERDAANGGTDVREGFVGPLRSGAGQVRVAVGTWSAAANAAFIDARNKARAAGLSTGAAYAAGLRASYGLVQDAAYYVGKGVNVLKPSSPPPAVPWIVDGGYELGAMWAGGIASAASLAQAAANTLAGGLSGLRSMPGIPSYAGPSLGSNLAIPAVGGISNAATPPVVKAGNHYEYHIHAEGQLKVPDPLAAANLLARFQGTGLLPEGDG